MTIKPISQNNIILQKGDKCTFLPKDKNYIHLKKNEKVIIADVFDNGVVCVDNNSGIMTNVYANQLYKNSSIKVEYFVWGLVDGEHKSFYVPADNLEKFMSDQKLSTSTKLQIRALKHCQGLELDKGFTIERRYTFGNGETSKKFKVQKFRTNLEA